MGSSYPEVDAPRIVASENRRFSGNRSSWACCPIGGSVLLPSSLASASAGICSSRGVKITPDDLAVGAHFVLVGDHSTTVKGRAATAHTTRPLVGKTACCFWLGVRDIGKQNLGSSRNHLARPLLHSTNCRSHQQSHAELCGTGLLLWYVLRVGNSRHRACIVSGQTADIVASTHWLRA